ncbi:hypothetical protein SAMN05421505_12089 [Sinosporangium album]|uniref:Uncharacterized protein n=1 Tax=Sinosporangium album TaxID=504805 RepID=A0A1G8EGK1_9ACTN|nr:hypothetical protein [Sinosporangium album]SDH68936.1 hypothetical protein SAMN05421505_12089 [Sinosporangium album]
MVDDAFVLDLDAARVSRIGTAQPYYPLRFRGEVICDLPVELPVDVLAPLVDLNLDAALIARTVLDAFSATDKLQAGMGMLQMFVDQVIINPSLPKDLVEAVHLMGGKLLGADGYARFVAARPSIGDVRSLVMGVAGRSGVGLGESPSSSSGSGGGGTSTPTSPTAASTSPASGTALGSPVSSAPDVSSTSPTVSALMPG